MSQALYTGTMSLQMKKKKKKKAKKKNAIKVILSTDEETDEEEDESGMYLEKDDVLLIYKALKNYKPVNRVVPQ
jgi:hypothetical protein